MQMLGLRWACGVCQRDLLPQLLAQHLQRTMGQLERVRGTLAVCDWDLAC